MPAHAADHLSAPQGASTPDQNGPRDAAHAKETKRKVVRRDPEKRRVQNLQAQKKYREKLRKRLDDLEALAASVAQGGGHTTPTVESPPELVLFDAPTNAPEPISDQDVVCAPLNGLSRGLAATAKETSRPAAPLAPTTTTTNSSSDLMLWDTATSINPSYLVPIRHADDLDDADSWHANLVDCGCPTRHVEIHTPRRTPPSSSTTTSSIITTTSSSPPSKPLLRISEPSLRAADLYMNNIRLEMACTVAAMWANCQHVGVTDSLFCEDETSSPFYREGRSPPTDGALVTTADDAVVRTVQRIFRTLKPDLRPVREQVTVPHHPCVDVFPFPTLRRNLLVGVAAGTEVDEDELFEDMVHGLVCWGSAGVGRGDWGEASGRVSSSSSPWDSRSWEARPWLLRKYWALFGGDEGELARQSEWWRGLRGEEEDIWTSCVS